MNASRLTIVIFALVATACSKKESPSPGAGAPAAEAPAAVAPEFAPKWEPLPSFGNGFFYDSSADNFSKAGTIIVYRTLEDRKNSFPLDDGNSIRWIEYSSSVRYATFDCGTLIDTGVEVKLFSGPMGQGELLHDFFPAQIVPYKSENLPAFFSENCK